MVRNSTIDQNVESKKQVVEGITIGIVVDTNDPQQMGRLRIMCPAWGDREDEELRNIPWAMYVTPFGGVSPFMHRGPERQYSSGPISYGMWAIPKVGAHAIVICLDGNPQYRAWLGCIHGSFLPHTMPAGRYLNNTSGPVTSTEQSIEPLTTNMSTAFTKPSGDTSQPTNLSPASTYEYRTRAAERQVSSVSKEILNQIVSGKPDKRDSLTDREGYQTSRSRDDLSFTTTGGNFDPQSYCITTPGLHSIIMDDSDSNGRIRLKTTSGNQIILDDTNERIYISTPHGNNWIELDKSGNIDIYSSRHLSVHALKDINFKTGGIFRVEAAGGIHLNQNNAAGDIRLTSAGSIHTKSGISTSIDSGTDVQIKAGTDMYLTAVSGAMYSKSQTGWSIDVASTLQINTIGELKIKSTGPLCLFSETAFFLDAPFGNIQQGGNCAQTVESIDSSKFVGAKSAYAVNRVPQHEPWGRIMSVSTDQDFLGSFEYNVSSTLELSYTSSSVGRVELGETITRNIKWRR